MAVLDELKEAAARLGFAVREERLLREVGYHVRGGRCRVGEQEMILLDRGLPPQVHIEILLEELSSCRLDEVYLSPAARELLERTGGGIRTAAPSDSAGVEVTS